MVRVDDVDEHHASSLSRGVEVVASPADYPYGERQYTARDFSGRSRVFSKSMDDVAPEEWGGTSSQPPNESGSSLSSDGSGLGCGHV